MNYEKGQRIGFYEIISLLKQNSFGDIYAGRPFHQQTEVVIEIFRQPLSDEQQEGFLRQAQMLVKLRHPHILPLRDAGVENHLPFLVTDAGTYQTLRDICLQSGLQLLAMLLPYLFEIASALDYAHKQGVFHGDLRPEKILLAEDNQLFLSGFLFEALVPQWEYPEEQADEIASSDDGPEQRPEKASPARDQYLLAMLVYELLWGVAPSEDTPISFLKQDASGSFAGVKEVLLQALKKDPERRFSDIETFVYALEEAYTQSGTTDSRLSVPAMPQRSEEEVSRPGASVLTQDTLLLEAEKTERVPITPVLAQPSTPFPRAVATEAIWTVDELVSEDTHLLASLPTNPQRSPRRDDTTMTRRSFAVGLMGMATLGGTGGWYLLSRRLSQASVTSTGADAPAPATHTTINNKRVLIFTGHLASVNALAWSPDGKMIVSASDDTYVQIFHASSGQRSVIYTGHTEEVAAVGWSPDGMFIASGGQDTTVQVWKAANGTRLLTYRGHTNRVNGLSWSNASQLLASGSDDRSVQIWNASDATIDFTFLGHTGGVVCVGWQPDNSSVASGSWDGTLRDWATAQHGDHFNAGEQIFSYDGHGKNEVSALSWSPDGSLLASAGADQTVQISKGEDGTPRRPFFISQTNQLHVNPMLAVAWSPDGNAIASGDANGNVYVWKVASRTAFFVYQGHKGAVNAVAWSPDGKTIASAGADSTVQVWQPG